MNISLERLEEIRDGSGCVPLAIEAQQMADELLALRQAQQLINEAELRELLTYVGALKKISLIIEGVGSLPPVITDSELAHNPSPAPAVPATLLHMAASAIEDLLSNLDNHTSHYQSAWAFLPDKLRAATTQLSGNSEQVTQFKPVADLYELRRDGDFVGYTLHAGRAAQYAKAKKDGCEVVEYVKLSRLQDAMAANSPVIPDGWRNVMTADDIAALRRFEECCDDPEAGGYDLDKEQVKRLELAGALRRAGRIHYITGFGDAVLAAPQPDHIRDATKMVLPPCQCDLCLKIVADSQSKGGNRE